MTGSLGLRHGRSYDVGAGRVAVYFLSGTPGGAAESVELAVAPDGGDGHRTTVRPGERFDIGTERWVFERAENVGTFDYVVWIAPVDGA